MRAAHQALLAEGFDFLPGVDVSQPGAQIVERFARNRAGRDLRPGWVPGTYLVAAVQGRVVGRASIRHRLNDHLARFGGHIGYAVLPEHRRCGHATEILRQSLLNARSHGIDRVLLTCLEGNVVSARVIERCGGVLENVVDGPENGERTMRFWIS